MERYQQQHIARKAGITGAFLSEIIANKKKPSDETAEKLSHVLPWTTPDFWKKASTRKKRAAFYHRKGYPVITV